MDLGRPIADMIPGPRGQLLATLAQLEAPVTIRALARYADVAPQTALNVVNDLADAGIVSAARAGSAQLITLNRAHIMAEPLIALSRTRARLIQRLTGELAAWPLLAGAWVFGSAARGTGDRGSCAELDGKPSPARRAHAEFLCAASAQRQSNCRCRARRRNRAHTA